MSFKSFACVAALTSLIAAPAAAMPSIQLVDTGTGVATLQVTPDAAALPGSIAVELDVTFTGDLSLTSAVIADGVTFDQANPGDSPFIAGSPIGGDVTGIDDVTMGSIFVAYGSSIINSAGPVDLLTINYSDAGNGGDIIAGANANIVAQAGSLNNVASDTLSIGGMTGIPGDFDMDGDVDDDDFGVFAGAFGGSGPLGDFDMDGDVDDDDFGVFAGNFGTGVPSASIPEPASAVLIGFAVAALAAGRRDS